MWNIIDFNYKTLYPTLRDDTNATLGIIADRIYYDITEVQEKNKALLTNIDTHLSNLKQSNEITINIEGNIIGNKEFIDDLVFELGKKLNIAGAI
jgi:hypothetical protein